MKHRRLFTLASCAAVVMLSGCLRGVGDDASDSAPEGSVSDAALFDQIANLPGVASADLVFQHPMGYSAAYAGRVTIDAGADPLCVLDEALSILHQGRLDVDLGILVEGPDMTYGLLSLVGHDGSAEERYGPQPTEPQPTATVRPCTPPTPGTSAAATATPTP
jgi:hypothetical protein